ncbi:MAG TPA: glycosyltransferase family 4 protein [Thermoanaerobaculia bacterium]|nr:glycosyltransferase family 4 protein [Thermoanaerobaculia bacterium]
MELLWIATKAPVPTIDGGRLVQLLTLQALSELGVRVTLVAPWAPGSDAGEILRALAPLCRAHLVESERGGGMRALYDLSSAGLPVAVARHRRESVRAEVARRIAEQSFTAVHVEQAQALPQAAPAFAAGLRVVLRAQNVESDLWRGNAGLHPVRRLVAALEGARLMRWEGAAVRQASAVVALSPLDAGRLEALSGGTGVRWVPPPFPARLPPAGEALAGRPPVVYLASSGWLPNQDAGDWLVREIWPRVRRRVPQAVLHLFTGAASRAGEGIVGHPPPADSRSAFPSGAVVIVPLRVGSGIRMKILEAWARGCPVVATPEAAAGLDVENDRHLLLARNGPEMAAAVARLHEEPGLRERLVAAGRELLERRHAPERVARELVAVYSGGESSPRPPASTAAVDRL